MTDSHQFDPSMNILKRPFKELDYFFKPSTVAVIGASEREGSVGKTIVHNLQKGGFKGAIYPVNPKRDTILGLQAYKSVKSIDSEVDLAVIVTPAKTVPKLVQECADKKVKCVVIISAGFKELGEPGEKLEEEVIEIGKKSGMRIIGPNCLGVMNTISGLNATFAADMALEGNLAFISQSGALLTAVLDWSIEEKVGFSSVVSIGSMADVSWGDLISYFGNDPSTDSILIYMESIGDPRAFLSAAREVALTKPIILIKAGRTEESAKAAASHTGSLAGSDDVLNAALRRVGVLRVDTISDLFSMAQILSKQPRPKGPHLSIITNAGGPGVIATDALIQKNALLADIGKEAYQKLSELLPEHWSRNNPIDILGDASPDVYGKAVKIIADDDNADGILVILTPQDMTDPTKSALELAQYSDLKKPVFASWMGRGMVSEGIDRLNEAGIPTFEYPDEAASSFAYMWQYTYNLLGIYETPHLTEEVTSEKIDARKAKIDQILKAAKEENRELLTEYESKKILEAYNIETVRTEIARSKDEAVKWANEIGYPSVLKLYSSTITHKTDVGGVKLNLENDQDVKRAFDDIYQSVLKHASEKDFGGVTVQKMMKLEGYELILGSSVDPQFGPTLLFGTGGQLVEVFKDRALALPPLTTTLARRMMEQTKIYEALKGVRGRKSVDLKKLEEMLVNFSMMIAEERWIKECDINPLLAGPDGLIALDARIILHKKDEEVLPLSIRPYPLQYVSKAKLKDDSEVLIRPIRPEDEELIIQFHQNLSEDTIRQRYLKLLHYDELIRHERLIHICFNDYDREIALLALKENEVLGAVRLTKVSGTKTASFALIIKDKEQNKGIGTHLMKKILEIAKEEKLDMLFAHLLKENKEMQKLLTKLGFSIREDGQYLLAELNFLTQSS